MKVPYPMAKGNGSTETYKQMAQLEGFPPDFLLAG